MKKIPVLIFLWIICLFQPIFAQVWPGDIIYNGIVNNVDLLYLGFVFDEEGPARPLPEQGFEWEEKNFDEEWEESFLDGTNYVYADCNGDGSIFYEDGVIINDNYGLTHGIVTPDVILEGSPSIHPTLRLISIGSEIIEGNPLTMFVEFGTEDLPVNDFYGLAFTIKYDTEIFNMNLDFDPNSFILSEDSFIGNPGQLLHITKTNLEEGTIEIAITRLDGEAIDEGFGHLGVFFVVVEDNVVGISDPDLDASLSIEKVLFFDADQNPQPAYGDSTVVTIINDDIVGTGYTEAAILNIYPNPTQNNLWIDCKNQILQQIKIYHHTGQTVFQQTYNTKIEQAQISTKKLPKGVYFIEIQTSNGIEVKNIILQ